MMKRARTLSIFFFVADQAIRYLVTFLLGIH